MIVQVVTKRINTLFVVFSLLWRSTLCLCEMTKGVILRWVERKEKNNPLVQESELTSFTFTSLFLGGNKNKLINDPLSKVNHLILLAVFRILHINFMSHQFRVQT